MHYGICANCLLLYKCFGYKNKTYNLILPLPTHTPVNNPHSNLQSCACILSDIARSPSSCSAIAICTAWHLSDISDLDRNSIAASNCADRKRTSKYRNGFWWALKWFSPYSSNSMVCNCGRARRSADVPGPPSSAKRTWLNWVIMRKEKVKHIWLSNLNFKNLQQILLFF